MLRARQCGFTLIELMVTVAVAVVLLGLAVPSFRDMIEKSRLRGATDDIVNLLNISRAGAVKLGLDVNASVVGAGTTASSTWCAGAVSATDPESSSSTIGNLAGTAAACDCTSSTACKIGGLTVATSGTTTAGGTTNIVSSSSYSGVKMASDANNALLNSKGGVVFNSKYGAIDFTTSANISALTLTSSSGKYSTKIKVSTLGQAYVCTPSTSKFVSGYPTPSPSC